MAEQAVMTRQDYSREQMKIIKATVAKQTTMEQFLFFIEVCKHTGLSPFARQIYAVVRGSDMTIQVSIDGYRVLAERTGKYAGQIGPEWCDESGEWKDVWLSNKPPVAARVGVIRRDFDRPVWGVARYEAYVQPTSPLWKKMPETMLAKCCESLALRKAFPAQLSGLYTSEEMAQADHQSSLPVVTSVEASSSDEMVEGKIVDAELPSESPQLTTVPTNGASPSASSPNGKTMPASQSEESGVSSSNLAQLITKAQSRANKLGLANDLAGWYAFVQECLEEPLRNADIQVHHIGRINGKLTQLEKERAA